MDKTLTTEQKTSVITLQGKLQAVDEMHKGTKWLLNCGENTYIRYLKGHGWNVNKAYKKMLKTSEWRWGYEGGASKLIENIEKDETKAMALIVGHTPIGIVGNDHAGRPVTLFHLTALDFPGLIREVGMDLMLKYFVYQMEKNLTTSPKGDGILIIDLGIDGLIAKSLKEVRTFARAVLKFVKKSQSILNNHYPESLSKIFFTRVPKTFWATFKMAKPFLSSRTLHKTEILTTSAPRDVLIKYMPESSIPDILGGKSKTVIGLGGKIPKGALIEDNKEASAYMVQMVAHVRVMKGELPMPTAGVNRFSLARTPSQEQQIQEQMALELLHHQVDEMKHVSIGAHKRGSWHFVPGLEWLENAEDEEILKHLKDNNLSTDDAMEKLKQLAIEQEALVEGGGDDKKTNTKSMKVRKQQSALYADDDDNEEENADEGEGCIIS